MTVYQTELGPGVLDIGPVGTLTSFASQVTKCTLTPKHDEEDDIPVLSGEVVAGDLTTSWTLEGEILQDFGTQSAKSLSEWTLTNNGKTFPFTFTPNSGGSKKLTGQLQVRATNIGGDVKKRNRADFTFKVIGDPLIAVIA
ncbi:MAG: hypothetical protein QM708_07220 [Propioniciclava sp.]|uniref:hypothetical protein n=1 Tax=Propioniciclava sp. TaxID=2038686 RepID=UPI0039E585A0